jgi:predicted nucleic acid-binding protein
MKYVLDASIAVKWVLPEPDSTKAIALRNDYRQRVIDLISPDIFPAEIAHALTRAERRGLIAQGESEKNLADFFSTAPYLYPYSVVLSRAVELSSQERIGVYDCLYVALAEREQCELATADSRLINAFQGKFPIVSLLSF